MINNFVSISDLDKTVSAWLDLRIGISGSSAKFKSMIDQPLYILEKYNSSKGLKLFKGFKRLSSNEKGTLEFLKNLGELEVITGKISIFTSDYKEAEIQIFLAFREETSWMSFLEKLKIKDDCIVTLPYGTEHKWYGGSVYYPAKYDANKSRNNVKDRIMAKLISKRILKNTKDDHQDERRPLFKLQALLENTDTNLHDVIMAIDPNDYSHSIDSYVSILAARIKISPEALKLAKIAFIYKIQTCKTYQSFLRLMQITEKFRVNNELFEDVCEYVDILDIMDTFKNLNPDIFKYLLPIGPMERLLIFMYCMSQAMRYIPGRGIISLSDNFGINEDVLMKESEAGNIFTSEELKINTNSVILATKSVNHGAVKRPQLIYSFVMMQAILNSNMHLKDLATSIKNKFDKCGISISRSSIISISLVCGYLLKTQQTNRKDGINIAEMISLILKNVFSIKIPSLSNMIMSLNEENGNYTDSKDRVFNSQKDIVLQYSSEPKNTYKDYVDKFIGLSTPSLISDSMLHGVYMLQYLGMYLGNHRTLSNLN